MRRLFTELEAEPPPQVGLIPAEAGVIARRAKPVRIGLILSFGPEGKPVPDMMRLGRARAKPGIPTPHWMVVNSKMERPTTLQ